MEDVITYLKEMVANFASNGIYHDDISVLNQIVTNLEKIDFGYRGNEYFRPVDYYSEEMTYKELEQNFKECYDGEDIDSRLYDFSRFCLNKRLEDISVVIGESDFVAAYEFLSSIDSFYQDILDSSIDIITKDQLDRESQEALENDENPFVIDTNGKFKILFTGFCEDDIKAMTLDDLACAMRKINGELSTDAVVSDTMPIKHVKQGYNIKVNRTRVDPKHRLAFVRQGDVTAIIGIALKTGNDIDYDRYDVVAAKKDLLYQEIADFSKGKLNENSVHNKVLAYLKECQDKYGKEGKFSV